jgi:hypothetical protein
MFLYSAFTVVAYQANKTLSARLGSTDGRPMVVTENSNPGQMEREKTSADAEKAQGLYPWRIQRGFAYHAARFHD